mgnify:CR=1 FL=1
MKVARFVLKVVALSLTAAAIICAIIAYWDKLVDLGLALRGKLKETKEVIYKSEYDDYVE